MPLRFPFWRTYRIRCPDGSEKLVHRYFEDAFPLSIDGWEGGVSGSVKAHEVLNGQVKGEYKSKIHGLLFSLDELNQSLMINFRAAYATYSTDPCANGGFLQRHVDVILREQHRLQMVRLQINALVHLAAAHPTDHGRIMDMFQALVQQIGGSIVPDAAASEITDTRSEMLRWIQQGDK